MPASGASRLSRRGASIPAALTAAVLACLIAVAPTGGTSAVSADPTAAPDDGSPVPTHVAPVRSVALDDAFTLAEGEAALVEGSLHLAFVSLLEDSRCPADVECVWEGNAAIELDVASQGADGATLRLDTNPGFATEATYLAYAITLIELEPYPRTDVVPDVPYRSTLIVSPVSAGPSPSPVETS